MFSFTKSSSMKSYWNKRRCLPKEKSDTPTGCVWNTIGRPSIVLEHDCGRHDVMKKLYNITSDNFACRQPLVLLFVFRNVYHVSFFIILNYFLYLTSLICVYHSYYYYYPFLSKCSISWCFFFIVLNVLSSKAQANEKE